MWTGVLPDGKLSRLYRAPGTPLGPAFGLKALTTNYRLDSHTFVSPLVGPRHGGMGRSPLVKHGRTMDNEIPAQKGYVLFKRVPVMRVYDIETSGDLIGLHKSFRREYALDGG